jgi:hypothetical protein
LDLNTVDTDVVAFDELSLSTSGGSFIDLDYAPELSDVGENQFVLSLVENGTVATYIIGSEGSDKQLLASGQNLMSDLVGQAFGPDVAGKGNDFAFCRDIGSKVQCWSGEQKDGSLAYHQRNKFEMSGEFVDIDFAPEYSTAGFNAFLVTVKEGGDQTVYLYASEGSAPGNKSVVSGNLGAHGTFVAAAFGPDVAGKQNDFRTVKVSGGGLESWIGEQAGSLKFHQRGKVSF